MPLEMAAGRFAYEADPFELDALEFVRRLLVNCYAIASMIREQRAAFAGGGVRQSDWDGNFQREH